MLRRSLTFIALLTCLVASGQEIKTPEELYKFLEPERDSNALYWNEVDSVKSLGKVARNFTSNLPKNHIGLFTLRYVFFSDLRCNDYNNEKANKNYSLLKDFIATIPLDRKNYDFYLQAALTYNTLFIAFKKFGDQDQARDVILTANAFLSEALDETNGDSTKYYSIIHKLIGINNNMGILLYQTTHYLDPEEKRSETGRLLESYFERVDSLCEFEDSHNSQFIDLQSRVTPYSNMAVIYGSYYRNQLKAQQYLDKARDLGTKLCKQDRGIECIRAGIQFQGALGWIQFANKNYREAVEILKPNLEAFEYYSTQYKELSLINGAFKIDMLCALNESYYHLQKSDSSLYYGELLLADSTLAVDYVVLANAAVLMSELYMDKNIKRSRELLSLSRRLVQQSEAEMVRSKYVAEGESKLLNITQDKLFELTEDIVVAEQREKLIIKVILLVGITMLALFIIYMVKRSRNTSRRVLHESE